jgi:hypothetical protein
MKLLPGYFSVNGSGPPPGYPNTKDVCDRRLLESDDHPIEKNEDLP